jgi:hypothetical protein
MVKLVKGKVWLDEAAEDVQEKLRGNQLCMTRPRITSHSKRGGESSFSRAPLSPDNALTL